MGSRRLKPKVIDLATRSRDLLVSYHLTAQDCVYLGQKRGDLVKLRRRTYEEMWRQPSKGFTPSAVEGTGLLLSSLSLGCARLDVDGHQIWQNDNYFAPSYVGDQLLAYAWAPEGPNRVARLDPNSGAVLREWMLPIGFGWPLCLAGLRALGTKGDLVIRYDLEREEIIWRKSYGSELVGSPREEQQGEALSLPGPSTAISTVLVETAPISIHPFDDETVLLDSIALARCSIADGSLLWRFKTRLHPTKPYRSRGRILFLDHDALVGLDEATGDEVFRRRYNFELDFHFATRETFGVCYRNRLAIPFEEGYLAIIDTDDGRIVSMHRERKSLWRAAEIDGDLLLCTGGGTALIYGPEIWQF